MRYFSASKQLREQLPVAVYSQLADAMPYRQLLIPLQNTTEHQREGFLMPDATVPLDPQIVRQLLSQLTESGSSSFRRIIDEACRIRIATHTVIAKSLSQQLIGSADERFGFAIYHAFDDQLSDSIVNQLHRDTVAFAKSTKAAGRAAEPAGPLGSPLQERLNSEMDMASDRLDPSVHKLPGLDFKHLNRDMLGPLRQALTNSLSSGIMRRLEVAGGETADPLTWCPIHAALWNARDRMADTANAAVDLSSDAREALRTVSPMRIPFFLQLATSLKHRLQRETQAEQALRSN